MSSAREKPISKSKRRMDRMAAVDEKPLMEPKDAADSFSQTLQQSIAAGEAVRQRGAFPAEPVNVRDDIETAAMQEMPVPPVQPPAEVSSGMEPGEDSMLRAQELLQMGCSTEQISKETNLGRGAIELMPLSYDILAGVGTGFISYAILKLFSGHWRQVHPLLYFFALLFALHMGGVY